jgi:hypothetical protein
MDLVKLIEDKYLSDGSSLRPMEFSRKAQFLTLDVITSIAFGEPFGDLTADKDIHDYLATVDRMLPAIHWFGLFPDLADLMAIPWIGKMVLPSSGDNVGVGKVMGLVCCLTFSVHWLKSFTESRSQWLPRDMGQIKRTRETCLEALSDMASTKKRLRQQLYSKCTTSLSNTGL